MKISKILLISQVLPALLIVGLIFNHTNSFGAHDSETGWTTVPTKASQIAVATAKRDAKEREAAARAYEAAEYLRLKESLTVAKADSDQAWLEREKVNALLQKRSSASNTERLKNISRDIFTKMIEADGTIYKLQAELQILSDARPDLAAGPRVACPYRDRSFAKIYAEIEKMELDRLNDTRQYRPGKQPSKKPRKRV